MFEITQKRENKWVIYSDNYRKADESQNSQSIDYKHIRFAVFALKLFNLCVKWIFRPDSYLNKKKRLFHYLKVFYMIFSFVFVISACDNNVHYNNFREFKNNSWNRFSELNFEFPVSQSTYNIYLLIKFDETYSYDELLLNTAFYTPSGEERFTNYEIKVKNKNGEFIGEKQDNYIELKFPLRKGFRFSKDGISKIEIGNLMTKIETHGILGLGIIVEKE